MKFKVSGRYRTLHAEGIYTIFSEIHEAESYDELVKKLYETHDYFMFPTIEEIKDVHNN